MSRTEVPVARPRTLRSLALAIALALGVGAAGVMLVVVNHFGSAHGCPAGQSWRYAGVAALQEPYVEGTTPLAALAASSGDTNWTVNGHGDHLTASRHRGGYVVETRNVDRVDGGWFAPIGGMMCIGP